MYGFRLPLGLRGGVSLSPRDFRSKPAPRALVPPSVYVIATDDGLCKIGVSCDPEARLKQLQTGCPYKLHIAYVCILASQAYEVETSAHDILSQQAVGGEWFKCSENQAIDAVNRAAATFGKRIVDSSAIAPLRPFPVFKIWLFFVIAFWLFCLYVNYHFGLLTTPK